MLVKGSKLEFVYVNRVSRINRSSRLLAFSLLTTLKNVHKIIGSYKLSEPLAGLLVYRSFIALAKRLVVA